MLKQKERTVIHPLFGSIRIEPKFAQVLELEAFHDLAYKSQLGTKMLSNNLLNARHTRLMHSIGVMHLTEKLLGCCTKKFSKYFTITCEERETLKLAALGHDIGHIAFSHSLEERGKKTHEERTIEYFEENADKINRIFGYDIVSSVIKIYKNNIDIENRGLAFEMQDELDILFIFASLLIGTIDCDRMEYLMSDKYLVDGEEVDFTSIFNYITIVMLNDSPTVGFEKEALPMLENFLITRFDQYCYRYYDLDAILVEMIMKWYKEASNWTEEYTQAVPEYAILAQMYNLLCDKTKTNSQLYRLAEIVLRGKRENLLVKKIQDDKKYRYFMQRLNAITSRTDIIKTTHKSVTIYDPKKNRVYIKDDDGVVRDIMKVSSKIYEMSINFHYVMVDLNPIYQVEERVAKNIRALFEDKPVEIEKKFNFPGQFSIEKDENTIKSNITNIFLQIPGIAIVTGWTYTQNQDVYYEDSTNSIPSGITMRYRRTSEEESYYIKLPEDDGTSITKRGEYKYPDCSGIEQFVELATALFQSENVLQGEKIELVNSVGIITERYKLLVEVQDSIIEIACDFSTYKYRGKMAKGYMLECELKQGDDISLWYLTKSLKSFGFTETNESKMMQAKRMLK